MCSGRSEDSREELAQKDASNDRRKMDLFEAFARAGQHEKAAQLVEQIRPAKQKNSEFLLSAARRQFPVAIPQDCVKPRIKAAVFVEAAERPVSGQERFLKSILRVLPMAQNGEGMAYSLGLVTLH